MPKIILQGYIEVPDADLEMVVLELPRHIELTRAEAGCLIFDIERDPASKTRFRVYEEFISQEAFDLHQQRVKASAWGSITGNVQRHYTITRV